MDSKQIRASLHAVVEQSREIVARAYDVSHLLLRARKMCATQGSYTVMDNLLVEALAQHQVLLCEVSAMLRRAESLICKIDGHDAPSKPPLE